MGSRLQVYLHKNTNKDFAITRNGSRCGQAEKMKLIFQKLHNQYDSIISYHDCLILDGELLPWSFIGQELINKEFSQYSSCIEQELICLQQDKTYQSLFPNNNIKQQLNGINIFKEQLELYASVSEPIFKGFNILSIDGHIQKNENQENIYQLLGNSEYKVINTDDIDIAINYFKELTEQKKYEGIVIKPIYLQENVAPYIKVRNENYLHLIYGYDYLLKYQKLCENKKIGKKLALSISQFNIGHQMLSCNNQEQLLDLACQMRFEINKENEIDTRL